MFLRSHWCIPIVLWVLFAIVPGCHSNNNAQQASTKPTSKSTTESKPVSLPNEGANTSQATVESYDSKMARAEQAFQNGDIEATWKLAKELMIERPKSPTSLFFAAKTLAKKGDLPAAIQLISQIDPNDPQAGAAAMGQQCEWLAQSGDLITAEAKLLALLKSYPNATPAIRLLIDIYDAQGRRWETAMYLDRLVRIGNFTEQELIKAVNLRDSYDNEPLRMAAIQFAPNEPYNKLGAIRLLVMKGQWNEVIEPLKQIVDARPELLEPWIWYGSALLNLGRLDQLVTSLSNRPSGFANHPEYWYLRGALHLHDDRTREAAQCFIQSIRLDRRHVASMIALSDCLMELEMVELSQQVRNSSADLIRIQALATGIFKGDHQQNSYLEIAKTYDRLGDVIGAFAWEAVSYSNAKKPFDAEMIEKQRGLNRDIRPSPLFLDKLSTQDWPIPNHEASDSKAPTTNIADTGTTSGTILFEDIARQLHLDANYDNGATKGRGWYIVESNGGGVSCLDYDRDGWPDLYFSQAGDTPTSSTPIYQPKQLFRSIASTRFQDVTVRAHVGDIGCGQGVGVSDIDQDGFSDLLIANVGAIVHYRNQGDGTFEKVELPQAPVPSVWNSSIQAADINGDSLPDIVQGVYIDGLEAFVKKCSEKLPTQIACHPSNFQPGHDRILFNQGDGQWRLAEQDLLNPLSEGYTLGTLITNIDQRDGNDVFFANDISANHLLLNMPQTDDPNALIECAASSGVAVDAIGRPQGCMGIACGDQDRNGLIDIIVTNNIHEGSTLYLQKSPGVFVDGTRRSNLGLQTQDYLSFGSQLADLDNDGWLDLTIVNGYIDDLSLAGLPWKYKPQILRNDKGRFAWQTNPSAGPYFDVENVGRGLTMLDYNRDGKIDLGATHLDRQCALLENRSPSRGNHYLQLELIGTQSERDAIGAIVHVVAGDNKWVAPVSVGDGFFGTNEHLIHLGLGELSRIDELSIQWPQGPTESFKAIDADQRLLVIQGIGIAKRQ